MADSHDSHDSPASPAKESRFFARIRTFDLACPRCGKVVHVHGKRKYLWNPRISKFICPQCNIRLYLGVIAHRIYPGPNRIPPDHVPTLEQSTALRAFFSEGFFKEHKRIRGGSSANEIRTAPVAAESLLESIGESRVPYAGWEEEESLGEEDREEDRVEEAAIDAEAIEATEDSLNFEGEPEEKEEDVDQEKT